MSATWKLEEQVLSSLRKLYSKYGYRLFKMSKFEAYDLYMQNKEVLVSDGVITFTDTDGTLMALKPDVTLSIVKNYRGPDLQKVCYNEHVYRISGATRTYGEIMQAGLECLGQVGPYEIGETLILAMESLRTISPFCLMNLSNLDLVEDLLNQTMLPPEDHPRLIACLARKNEDQLLALCGQLPPEQQEFLLELLHLSCPLSQAIAKLETMTDSPALESLRGIQRLLDHRGYGRQVRLDLSIGGDSNYYNGFIFRGYIEGLPQEVLSGGQYDGLMEKMGKHARGIGFAVYLDQLERLQPESSPFDVDTVLLYAPKEDLCAVSDAVTALGDVSVLALPQKPEQLHYRRLMELKDGRWMTLETNG